MPCFFFFVHVYFDHICILHHCFYSAVLINPEIHFLGPNLHIMRSLYRPNVISSQLTSVCATKSNGKSGEVNEKKKHLEMWRLHDEETFTVTTKRKDSSNNEISLLIN